MSSVPVGELPPLGQVPDTMWAQAIRQDRFGDPRQAFKGEEVPVPELEPDEVLVGVMAAGMNYNNVWAALGVARRRHRRAPAARAASRTSTSAAATPPASSTPSATTSTNVKVGDEVVIHCGAWDVDDPCVKAATLSRPQLGIWGFDTNYGLLRAVHARPGPPVLPKPPHLTWEEAAALHAGRHDRLPHAAWLERHTRSGKATSCWSGAAPAASAPRHPDREGGRRMPVAVVSGRRARRVLHDLGAEGYINRTTSATGASRRTGPTRTAQKAWSEARARSARRSGTSSASAATRASSFEHPGQATIPTSIFVCEPGGMVVICAGTTGYSADVDLRYHWVSPEAAAGVARHQRRAGVRLQRPRPLQGRRPRPGRGDLVRRDRPRPLRDGRGHGGVRQPGRAGRCAHDRARGVRGRLSRHDRRAGERGRRRGTGTTWTSGRSRSSASARWARGSPRSPSSPGSASSAASPRTRRTGRHGPSSSTCATGWLGRRTGRGFAPMAAQVAPVPPAGGTGTTDDAPVRYAEIWDADQQSNDPIGFPGYVPPSPDDESVRTGLAVLGGVPAAVVECRFPHHGGTMGAVAGDRIVRAFRRATARRLPVVAFIASGGARLQEGMVSLVQMARTSSAVLAHRRAGLLFVAVLRPHSTGGVYASWASLSDLKAATPGATVGFGGPRVVEQVTGELPPPTSHTAESAYRNGLVDALVDEADQVDWLGGVLAGTAPALVVPPGRPTRGRRARRSGRPVGCAAADPAARDPSVGPGVGRVAHRLVGRAAGPRPDDPGGTRVHRRPAARRRRQRPARGRARSRAARRGRRRRPARPAGVPAGPSRDAPRGPARSAGADPRRHAGSRAQPGRRGRRHRRRDRGLHITMAGLTVPTVALCVGEGGSGGAMALSHGDRFLMLDGAVFSVIGPEAGAAILYRRREPRPRADPRAEDDRSRAGRPRRGRRPRRGAWPGPHRGRACRGDRRAGDCVRGQPGGPPRRRDRPRPGRLSPAPEPHRREDLEDRWPRQ